MALQYVFGTNIDDGCSLSESLLIHLLGHESPTSVKSNKSRLCPIERGHRSRNACRHVYSLHPVINSDRTIYLETELPTKLRTDNRNTIHCTQPSSTTMKLVTTLTALLGLFLLTTPTLAKNWEAHCADKAPSVVAAIARFCTYVFCI